MNRRIPMKASICIPVPSTIRPRKSQITSSNCVFKDMFNNTSVPFLKHKPTNLSEHSENR